MDETDLALFKSSKNKDKKEKTDSHATKAVPDSVDAAAVKKSPIRSVPTSDTHYDTNNKYLGAALVFNHKEIKGQEPRKGTKRDCERVTAALTGYGFDVRVYNDLSFAKINEELNAVAKQDHSNSDCLVIVVMTHGINNNIFAKDMHYPVNRLWTPFLGDSCKSLINKPKLFFIQACRGTKLDKPVEYTSRTSTMSRIQTDTAQTPMTYAIPSTADLMVFYSTFEGHYSFRNVENGSWFIQCLCKTLEEAAANSGEAGVELFQLLTTVNRSVAYEYQSFTKDESKNEMKEMPNFLSTLTKTFYLKVKRIEGKRS